MDLVSVIIYGFNICRVIVFFVFFGEVLLNWSYRRAKSKRGFSESKLSSLLVPCWESLLWKGWSPYLLVFQKQKFYCNKKDSTRAHLSLGDICITLYMNPWLTNITLNCKIFIINVYMANFAGVKCINIFWDTH